MRKIAFRSFISTALVVLTFSSSAVDQKLKIDAGSVTKVFDLYESGELEVVRENTSFIFYLNATVIQDNEVHVFYHCQFNGNLGFSMNELAVISFPVNAGQGYSCGSKYSNMFFLSIINE
ncbi:hypothetical protein FJ444_21215 [Aestuariibacter sp. GS-14]|uniref:hypothetical protein n=1 Tax=Aestuariibacter sp. GS-14 TaxID=2590670 RepID=UPI00112C2256|nr:hypothetical protein [Aestuariibacter sp. GS-14]TPV51737.1 hypothetical protein FJ444_21215 [Aestuariibacter sp. GS-14]